jgi:cytochrome c-type biogenesis protein CcmH
MTLFVAAAALLALAAVLFVILPLLRRRDASARAGIAAAVVALVLIAGSALTYSLLGNPAGIRLAAGANQNAQDIGRLARQVEDQPDDFSAWLQLGGAYSNSNQYELALHAYARASDLANGTSALALTGMGEALLLGQGLQAGSPTELQAAGYFNRALQLDPKSPKGLYYSGLLAYQSGQLELARTRFSAMLTITPPPPQNVRADLQKMIDLIDTQLHPPIDAATAIRLHVSLAPDLAGKVPPKASLFVFVQSPGGGAPLAVKRASTQLPQDVVLSADDAMIAQHAVKPGQKVTVVARISVSGSPLPQHGDLYGQIEYVAGKTGPRPLQIDKLSP